MPTDILVIRSHEQQRESLDFPAVFRRSMVADLAVRLHDVGDLGIQRARVDSADALSRVQRRGHSTHAGPDWRCVHLDLLLLL
jgi:hypothetical protein